MMEVAVEVAENVCAPKRYLSNTSPARMKSSTTVPIPLTVVIGVALTAEARMSTVSPVPIVALSVTTHVDALPQDALEIFGAEIICATADAPQRIVNKSRRFTGDGTPQ